MKIKSSKTSIVCHNCFRDVCLEVWLEVSIAALRGGLRYTARSSRRLC